jgi:hypothetical protein
LRCGCIVQEVANCLHKTTGGSAAVSMQHVAGSRCQAQQSSAHRQVCED